MSAYKVGARLSPVPDVTLRGTFSTAFRAPSIADLYAGTYDSFPADTDPCADREQGTPVDAACDQDGLPDDFADDRMQMTAKNGGNRAAR